MPLSNIRILAPTVISRRLVDFEKQMTVFFIHGNVNSCRLHVGYLTGIPLKRILQPLGKNFISEYGEKERSLTEITIGAR